jgi:DNA-binding transcriptional MerR regulator
MSEPRLRQPNEVAAQLQVSPSTLRRWSSEFADYLSDSASRPGISEPQFGSVQPAGGAGQAAHRRYTDQDLETLMAIKGLLAEGLTYIQVGKRLEALHLGDSIAALPEEDQRVTVLGPSLQQPSSAFPAVAVLADTLHTVANGQQMLLGSQQANRDLLSVVIQDNFALKEENAKLRDRMLELERDLAEIRRLDAVRRESLDARLHQLEEQSRRPVGTAGPQPGAPAPQPRRQQRSGCLAQLLGLFG